MKDLLDEIINKNFDIAETLLKGHLASIVESKLNEKKKMCAAEMTDYPDLPKSGQKLRRGLTEDETEPPFVPDKEKSTDWKNPKAKAKQLARKAMKAQKEKADKKLDEASLKQAWTKAKKVLGHKKRVSDAAAKAMDSDSWQKNLANVTKVVKKND